MAESITTVDRDVPGEPYVLSQPAGSIRYDWVMLALCAWLIGGLYLDGWAHAHKPDLETFFTPWHAVLYSGFAAAAGFVFATFALNVSRGHTWKNALPPGYMLSLTGGVIFLVGGVFDGVWHTVFGIEEDVDALLSPTHLALAFGGALILSGPLRSAWLRKETEALGPGLWPGILSLAFVLCTFTFFTQFAHPFVEIFATTPASDPSAAENRDVSNIFFMDADGRGQTRVTYDAKITYNEASWTADNTGLVAVVARHDDSERGFVKEIHIVAAGGEETVLASAELDYDFAALSPDGTQIAFIAWNEGTVGLYVMNADGTGTRLLTDEGVRSRRISWSPDGAQIGFSSDRDGNPEIYTFHIDPAIVTRLTNSLNGESAPSWSPDGRKLVYTSDRTGNIDVYMMSLDDGSEVRLTSAEEADVIPTWSPDGRRIAFMSDRDGNLEIYAMNSDGTGQVNLTNSPASNEFWPAWSGDGTRIAYTSIQERRQDFFDFRNQALGISSILLQAAVLMGVVLLAVRRWQLPTGTFTILFAINGLAMAALEDTYYLVAGAVFAGMLTDVLLWQLRPSAERVWAFRVFAIVPAAAFFAAYFATLAIKDGVGWPIELWAGSIVLAGVIGWLMSYVALPPVRQSENRSVLSDAR